MIHLDDATVLEAVLSAAAATTNPDITAFYVDDVSSATPDAKKNAVALTGATAVTLVAAAASGKKRAISTIALHNKDTAAVTLTIRTNASSTIKNLITVTLQVGDNFGYEDRGNYYVTDSSGQLRVAGNTSGRIIRTTQYLTSGTAATYTPPASCWAFQIRMVGGGGGGGGAASTAANCAAASGGSASSPLVKFLVNVGGTATYTVGTKGTGGAAGNNNGNAGNNTTFAYNSVTYTATGGNRGTGSAAGTAAAVVASLATSAATNGDINGVGQVGGPGYTLSGTVGVSGYGGSGLFGGGGAPLSAEAAGNNATGYGSGGSGALSLGTSTRAGGDGSDGLIEITEYY